MPNKHATQTAQTQRAKRFQHYIESRFGWETRGAGWKCPKCGDKQFSGSYCPHDGTKMVRQHDDSLEQIEAAMAYALKEKTR